ncbi:hypothetical protein TARUN_10516, partial [Trichoderma arundinaceum]
TSPTSYRDPGSTSVGESTHARWTVTRGADIGGDTYAVAVCGPSPTGQGDEADAAQIRILARRRGYASSHRSSAHLHSTLSLSRLLRSVLQRIVTIIIPPPVDEAHDAHGCYSLGIFMHFAPCGCPQSRRVGSVRHSAPYGLGDAVYDRLPRPLEKGPPPLRLDSRLAFRSNCHRPKVNPRFENPSDNIEREALGDARSAYGARLDTIPEGDLLQGQDQSPLATRWLPTPFSPSANSPARFSSLSWRASSQMLQALLRGGVGLMYKTPLHGQIA